MVRTTHLGGTASNIEIAGIAHGLMRMTWVPNPVPDEQAFEAIKTSIDAAGGAKVLLNSGEFYGTKPITANLELLSRFFEKYPEYADKTVLSVKGGTTVGAIPRPLATEENIRRSVDAINAALRGKKRLDIFENARVDPQRSIEDTVKIMMKLIDEGKFDHIGLSECSAETLRRANTVHPIASVEIEVSPFEYEERTRKVIAVAAELKIPVLAYSPQAAGFLTGKFRSANDFEEGDFRRYFDRMQPENIENNTKIVERLTELGKKKGVTPGQLSIAWVMTRGPHVVPLPGSSHSDRTLENWEASQIALNADEIAQVDKLLDTNPVQGARYFKGTTESEMVLWG